MINIFQHVQTRFHRLPPTNNEAKTKGNHNNHNIDNSNIKKTTIENRSPMLPHEDLEPVHIDPYTVRTTPTVPGTAPLLYPAVDGEVRRLRQVEPVIEPAVIGARKRNHELAGFLLSS